ncbi:hypothetical protein FV113G1_P10540 (plasmid) [Fusobacterium varium]|nr:hypothetical protein FV113G1_P10540 [Fusobacterium varium]
MPYTTKNTIKNSINNTKNTITSENFKRKEYENTSFNHLDNIRYLLEDQFIKLEELNNNSLKDIEEIEKQIFNQIKKNIQKGKKNYINKFFVFSVNIFAIIGALFSIFICLQGLKIIVL